MSKKDWIGELRIYLLQRGVYRSFCWMNMQQNGSLLFSFSSKTARLIEYGRSVVQSGNFVDHSKTITRGTIDIKDAKHPHISFHPPRITQKSGIAHLKDANGNVDEWDLDWFPVKNSQAILYAYSGDISKLSQVVHLKGNHQVVDIPNNVDCIQMELVLYPKSVQIVGRWDVLTNIIGVCPHYIVCCHFLPIRVVDLSVYIATDEYSKEEK